VRVYENIFQHFILLVAVFIDIRDAQILTHVLLLGVPSSLSVQTSSIETCHCGIRGVVLILIGVAFRLRSMMSMQGMSTLVILSKYGNLREVPWVGFILMEYIKNFA
jgi:hypothetical protein